MTRQEAKERLATALCIVGTDRTSRIAGCLFPPFGNLAPDIESWPLTRFGGERPFTAFEWFVVHRICFRDAPHAVDFSNHDRGSDTTVGDLITAIQEAHAVPEHRPEVRGM